MESYEANIAQATARETREILGAIGIVFDKEGTTLYHNASGYQSLAPDAPPVDPNSTFVMASAGKFITHIAALQCVERGLVTLDEPISPHLPELENLNVLSKSPTEEYLLKPPTKKVTLRHLLSYSSGIDHESNALIQEWRTSTSEGPKSEYNPCWKLTYNPEDPYTTPLLFKPGEGWIYGASLEWTQLLVCRLTQVPFGKHIHETIFEPLGMVSTTYNPEDHPNICERVLQTVRRDGDHLVPVEGSTRSLVSSMPDFVKLLSDLLSPTSKLLKQEHVHLLFEPQFSPGSAALNAIRNDTENYAFPAGIPPTMKEPAVNHSLAALVIEEEMPLSKMPTGTVTWNGMPNLIWAMHRGKELGMVFMTQLLPVDDGKTVDLAMEFFRGAWGRFG